MLKKICGLFMGLIVCAGSACVTPTHASSAQQVVIRYVQATGTAGARDELIVVHNNTALRIEVTDWCLKNKANVLFVCFTATPEQEQMANGDFRYFLPAYGDMTIASVDHAMGGMYTEDMYSFTYVGMNQSSGSLVNSADSLSLVDENGETVDIKTWSTAIQSGKALARMLVLPNIYATSNDTADWQVVATIPFIESALQADIYELNPEEPEEEPEQVPEEGIEESLAHPVISELFPNPSGADAGKEFVELHNPSSTEEISLDTYSLQIGLTAPKFYTFPEGVKLSPGQYRSFSDDEFGLTLVNTSGYVRLLRNGTPVGGAVEYSAAKEDQSWALIDGVWTYTNQVTPGNANTFVSDIEIPEDEALSVVVKPCASNQYRNPETGRCKLVAVSTTPTPCKEGQERNPETNRCRSIAATASEPSPCKEGQERNPETNRCRAVVKMTDAKYEVKGIQQQAGAQLSWYYIIAIALSIGAIITYGIWEWRHELLVVWRRIRKVFARHQT